MEIIAFIIALVAVAVFAVAATNKPVRYNLIAIGLALLTTSWIVELITVQRQVHT